MTRKNRVPEARELGPFLERTYERFHGHRWIGSDPLGWPRRYESPADREVVAYLASALAYGNVAQIDRSLADLFGRMGRSPSGFIREFGTRRSEAALEGFYHRFNDADDLRALLGIMGQILRGWGSLESFWAEANATTKVEAASGRNTISDRAGKFIRAALALELPRTVIDEDGRPRTSLRHLMPQVDGPSACKRFHLFLRWVVRPDDGVDLGLWSVERPTDLEFPVDTHILRLSRYLGATERKSAVAKTRREITEFFRRIDADDPVRFDFSLCRLGILRRCPTRENLDACKACDLKAVCSRYAAMVRVAPTAGPKAGMGAGPMADTMAGMGADLARTPPVIRAIVRRGRRQGASPKTEPTG